MLALNGECSTNSEGLTLTPISDMRNAALNDPNAKNNPNSLMQLLLTENSERESSNSCSSIDDDLSAMVKQVRFL